MLSNHQNFPVPILHVLTEQSRERASHMVPTANTLGLINFPPRAGEAQVVFVILVADQFFVEITDALKNALLPATVNHGVHIAFITGLVRARAAHCESRMKHGANRPFHKCLGRGLHGSANIVGFGFAHDRQALLHIIGCIDGMSIHANDDFTAGGSNGRVQPGGHNATGIVENTDLGILCGDLLQILDARLW